MNRTLLTLLCAAASAAPLLASAASSVQMDVRGTIFTGACDISMSKGSVIDVGRIPVSQLNADKSTSVGPGGLLGRVEITCPAPTIVSIKTIDERSGTAAVDDVSVPQIYFGLGKAGAVNIGRYHIMFLNSHVDGIDADVSRIDPGKGVSKNDPYSEPGSRFVYQTRSETAPAPHKTYDSTLGVHVSVQKASALHITEETPIDGLTTFELVYE
ncbi:DUF1120 domain-containing protein [Bordetella sp. 15P40C-2]|uniref:DUF1120 domain-containing protein n=1 Tax=Bordetella sp. 15P40C-2 TaxID=2572246 RepID=UPI00136650A1|nr:DUF1120 domain-containing protein [Bordetella sp. 15P40C-2]